MNTLTTVSSSIFLYLAGFLTRYWFEQPKLKVAVDFSNNRSKFHTLIDNKSSNNYIDQSIIVIEILLKNKGPQTEIENALFKYKSDNKWSKWQKYSDNLDSRLDHHIPGSKIIVIGESSLGHNKKLIVPKYEMIDKRIILHFNIPSKISTKTIIFKLKIVPVKGKSKTVDGILECYSYKN